MLKEIKRHHVKVRVNIINPENGYIIMSINIRSRVREVIQNSVIYRGTIVDLINELNLPTNADVLHIFDLPQIKYGINFNYKGFTRLLDVAMLRKSIEEVGVINPITVAKGNNRLWIIDGGTRIEAINPDTIVDWRILNINPEDSIDDLIIALTIALNTMMSKFTLNVAVSVYTKLLPVFKMRNINDSDVFGVNMPYVSEYRHTRYKRLSIIANHTLGKLTRISDDETRLRAVAVINSLHAALSRKSKTLRTLSGKLITFSDPAEVLYDAVMYVVSLLSCRRYNTAYVDVANLLINALRESPKPIKVDYTIRMLICTHKMRKLCGDCSNAVELMRNLVRKGVATPIAAAAALTYVKPELRDTALRSFNVDRHSLMYNMSKLKTM